MSLWQFQLYNVFVNTSKVSHRFSLRLVCILEPVHSVPAGSVQASPWDMMVRKCARNVILPSHMLNPVSHAESGLWLRKASSRAHLGHAHMHWELDWSIQKLYESLPLRKWNDICLTSELFGCLQPTAQPTYSVHFGEHLPSLWDGPGTVINILSTQSPYNIFK